MGVSKSHRFSLDIAHVVRWLGLACCAFSGCAYTDWRAEQQLQTRWASHWHGVELDLEGTVNGVPMVTMAPSDVGAAEPSFAAQRSVRVVFRIERILAVQGQTPDENGRVQALQRLPQDVLLTWSGGLSLAEGGLHAAAQDMMPGQRWRMRVVMHPVHGLLNPGTFDQELWLWSQGIHTRAAVRARWQDPPPQLLQAAGLSIDSLRQQTRAALQAQTAYGGWPHWMRVDPGWRERSMGVVAALAVGDQRAISAQDWEIFRETGVSHLVSISGMHITLFAALGIPFLTCLWRQTARISPIFCWRVSAPVVGLWGGISLAMLYALFSGWGIPAQRTVWMLFLAGLLKHLGLGWPWWVRCLCIATFMALLNPWSLLQPGFWLSFVAVAMLLGQNDLPKAFAPASEQTMAMRLWGGTQRMVSEQMRIAWVLAPLGMLFFAQVSVVGLAANIVAVPWVTGIVTPLSLLGAAWPALWDWAGLAMYPLLMMLKHMAQWPIATWTSATPPWPVAALAVLVAGWWVQTRAWRKLRRFCLGTLVLPALFWRSAAPAWGEFTVTALDIGQGNALVVRTHGHLLIYDTGTASAGERVLLPWLAHQGLRPDRIIVSHSDSDHSGGAQALLDKFPQAQVWASVPENSELHLGLLARAQGGVQPCAAPVAWTWDGVAFEFMHPQGGGSTPASAKPNANSCVLRVTRQKGAQSASVLLTADIEAAQEAVLTEAWQANRLPALNVLLVPHHGSQTSSSVPFLQATSAQMAWVQAGVNNLYGHPAPRVMQRYRDLGITVFQSSSCGAATWRSEQADAMHCHRQSSGRYWHRPVSAG